jgi:23S rRNA pseudouridine955/2504/2580 synthase
MHRYIRVKRIKVNGKKSEPGYRLVQNDVVDFYINDEFFKKTGEERAFLDVTPQFTVIYEDQNILLVDKPTGLLVHSDNRKSINTLINQIQAYLFNKNEYNPDLPSSFAPALCNRLDRNTAGIVIAAKNAEALRIMNQKTKNREISKYYLCLVHGVPENDQKVHTAYLFKDVSQNRVHISETCSPGARPVSTSFEVLHSEGNQSLLKVHLLTGRSHQIRAHLAYLGHPLVGDRKYGKNKQSDSKSFASQALYAYQMDFHFRTSGGILEYLNGKSFQVQRVPFDTRPSD